MHLSLLFHIVIDLNELKPLIKIAQKLPKLILIIIVSYLVIKNSVNVKETSTIPALYDYKSDMTSCTKQIGSMIMK